MMSRFICLILAIPVLFFSVGASDKAFDFVDEIGDAKVSFISGEIKPDLEEEIIKIDDQIELLIRKNSRIDREQRALYRELSQKTEQLALLEKSIDIRRGFMDDESLAQWILQVEEKEITIENLQGNIDLKEDAVRENKEELSLLKGEREKLYIEALSFRLEKEEFAEKKLLESDIKDLVDMSKVLIGGAPGPLGWPLKEFGEDWITDTYGIRDVHPVTGEKNVMHHGIDIGIPYTRWPGSSVFSGVPVYVLAAADGIAYSYKGTRGYGNYVVVVHDERRTTLYAHNHENLVDYGERVRKGQLIAIVGSTGTSTGPHLHFEVRLDGKCVDPMRFY
jgi:murein DD-endopeptidase MepM/ murein hydrolase activator NlpD